LFVLSLWGFQTSLAILQMVGQHSWYITKPTNIKNNYKLSFKNFFVLITFNVQTIDVITYIAMELLATLESEKD
jgi:hypothetical protein